MIYKIIVWHLKPIAVKKILGFVAILIVAGFASAFLLSRDTLSELETRSWDWRLKAIAQSTTADPAIKIIMIDQSSLEQISEEENLNWPWPRELYVTVIEFLKKAQAKGLALDMIFSEPSFYGVSDDQRFAESFQGSMPVVASVALRTGYSAKLNKERDAIFASRQEKFLSESTDPSKSLLSSVFLQSIGQFHSVSLPIPEVLQAAHGFGNVAVPNDRDGVFRHALIAGSDGLVPVFSLPFALLQAARVQWNPSLDRINSKGEFAIRFAGRPSRTYETYSFYAIMKSYQAIQEGQEPVVPLSEFKDSYVFLGVDAPGLMDLRPTPLSPAFPGVKVHATVFDNALHNSFIKEAGFSLNLAFALICAMFGGLVLAVHRPTYQGIIVVVCIGLVVGGAFLAAHQGIWIQMMVPLSAALFSILTSLALQYQLEGHHSRFLKNAFKYYVSEEVIDKLIADPTALSLGGDRRELTIFFCDIVGFTGISEKMDAQDLGEFLNVFLTEMSSVLLEHKGTIDKYVGDAIIAFWNAPVPIDNHPVLGVKGAMACLKRLKELEDEFRADFSSEVKIRIGLHTGVISVGNFGSEERFNYTIIGDAANLASRLEGANKYFGTDILVSEDTYRRIKDEIPCRKIATIRVLGREETVAVYEPLCNKDPRLVEEWNKALSAFEAGELELALQLLQSLKEDKLKEVFLDAIMTRDRSIAWSPVISLKDK